MGSSRGDCKTQLFLVPELQVEMPENHRRGEASEPPLGVPEFLSSLSEEVPLPRKSMGYLATG